MSRGAVPRSLPFLLFLVVAGGSLYLLLRPRVVSVEQTRVLMDTHVSVQVRAEGRGEANAAIEAAFAEMERVARLLDWFDSTTAPGRAIPPDSANALTLAPEIERVVAAALDVARLSDGAYDPTIRPLSALWGFESSPRVPPDSAIAAARACVDFRRLCVRDGRAWAEETPLWLDLGGVAKGYAVDRAREVLARAPGVRGALVAAAGDIQALGEGPREGEWRIGLAHPRRDGELIARFALRERAVSTSGDYERFFIRDATRYHHLLDPRTGRPARRCLSATVFAPTGIEADALATACFVAGPDAGRRMLARRPGVEAIWIVERDGRLLAITTPGLAGGIGLDVESADKEEMGDSVGRSEGR